MFYLYIPLIVINHDLFLIEHLQNVCHIIPSEVKSSV